MLQETAPNLLEWNTSQIRDGLLSRKPSFVHAFTSSSLLGLPHATQQGDKCHETSEMRGGHFWVYFESGQAVFCMVAADATPRRGQGEGRGAQRCGT